MLLKFKNLTIRNAAVDDAKQLAIWWNDGTIMAHAGFPNGLGQTVESITDSLKIEHSMFMKNSVLKSYKFVKTHGKTSLGNFNHLLIMNCIKMILLTSLNK